MQLRQNVGDRMQVRQVESHGRQERIKVKGDIVAIVKTADVGQDETHMLVFVFEDEYKMNGYTHILHIVIESQYEQFEGHVLQILLRLNIPLGQLVKQVLRF